MAKLATYLYNPVYNLKKVLIKKIAWKDGDVLEVDGKLIVLQTVCWYHSLLFIYVLLADGAGSTPEEELVTLNDEKGILILLKLLVKFRDDFPKGGNKHDEVLGKMLPILRKKGVIATLNELRAKGAALRDQFTNSVKKGNTNYRFFRLQSVVFGKEPLSELQGTPDEVEEDDSFFPHEEEKYLANLIRFAGDMRTFLCSVHRVHLNCAISEILFL